MNVNLTVAETDRSINMTVPDDLHEISLDASPDSYEFEMDVDGEIDFDVTSYSGAYLFRQLPYSSNAKSLRKLVGCSFAWNQNARYLNRRSVRPCFGATNAQVVSETNRSMTVTGVANTNYWNDLPSGHRILATAIMTVDGTPVNNMQVNFGGNIVSTGVKLTNGVPTQIAVIGTQKGTGGGSSYNDFYFYPNGTGGAALNSFTITDFQLFDLTKMFGSTIADYIYNLGNVNGYSFFKNLFLKDYYPYDAGSIVSVKTSASKMIGVNLLDSTNIFQGNFDSYGQAYIYNVVTGFIRVLPNTRYYERKRFQTSGCYVRLYKADKTTYTSINKYVSSDFDFTTAADTAYVRLMWYKNTGITTTDVIDADCCLNVYDASINGTYVPYVKSEYALSNTELRGIPKLDANNKLYYDGDEYTADGTVKRKYGIVDLGTLSWTKRNTSTGHWRFTTQDIPIKWNSASDAVGNMVCPRYQSVSASNTWNGITGISSHTTMTQLLVCDETYSDAAAFKTAMSGVYLIYELATPTMESATPYTQAQKCYPNGTEEFVDGRIVEVPVWNEAKYIQ